MDKAFWLGLAFSIPIGVLINLFTPQLQSALAKRNSRAREARKKRHDQLLVFARRLRDDPFAFAVFAERANARLIVYAVLMILLVNIPFYASVFIYATFHSYLADVYNSVIAVVAIILITAALVAFLNARRRQIETLELAATLKHSQGPPGNPPPSGVAGEGG
jgi:hypothetical protein